MQGRPYPQLTARGRQRNEFRMRVPGPTSNSFISQRLRLHYVDWGNPEAPPLILQHTTRMLQTPLKPPTKRRRLQLTHLQNKEQQKSTP